MMSYKVFSIPKISWLALHYVTPVDSGIEGNQLYWQFEGEEATKWLGEYDKKPEFHDFYLAVREVQNAVYREKQRLKIMAKRPTEGETK